MPKGDIILIPFPFTDLTGNKLRPALVLTEDTLDVTVSFITSQLEWREPTDIVLQPNNNNGVKKTSLIRLNKIATIEKGLIIGLIGSVDLKIIAELNLKLKSVFQLP